MFRTRWIAATAVLLAAGVAEGQADRKKTRPSTVVGSSEVKKKLDGISREGFDTLHELIKPAPGGFEEIPWMTSLWDARKKAAAEGKPMFIWAGGSHPLGVT